MTLVEGIKTATILGPPTGTHGFYFIAGLAQLALGLGGSIVPVHGADMVAVSTVFGGQLPVAFINIRGRAAKHFQAFGRLVDDHVDDLRRFTQVLHQRYYIGIEAAEQKAAIGLEASDLCQVMGTFAVEARRVTGINGILDLKQLARIVEGPAVERTSVG
ncbi:hypothetical protein D3C73_1192020 [compost metagenome]